MRKFFIVATCSLCVSLSPALAQGAGPEIRQFDIATLEKLGHEIFEQDQAAWHATDALLAQHQSAQLMAERVQGWIVEGGSNGTLVRFIRVGNGDLEAAYDIRYPAGADFARDKPAVSTPDDRHLTDTERAQYSAGRLAAQSVTSKCGDNYNIVVLKDPESDGWLAWALAATENPSLVMLGGHVRLTVSVDGQKILRRDALSRSCFVMDKKDPPEGKLAELMMTQIVSNVPVESLVFQNLQHGIPIAVGTPDGKIWEIKNGRITAAK